MPVQVIPRRAVAIDDSRAFVRPVSPRRNPPPAHTALTAVTRAAPAGLRSVGRNDPDYLGITPGSAVPNYAARGNNVAATNALTAVVLPGSNTGAGFSKYQMGAFESETYQTFRDAGVDDRHLFAGQRAVWEDADDDPPNPTHIQPPQPGWNDPDFRRITSGSLVPRAELANPTNANPCIVLGIYPVFGTSGNDSLPRVAGGAYNGESHRGVDIVPLGAYTNYPESTYLAPNWSTVPNTQEFNSVYAVTSGQLFTVVDVNNVVIPDAVILRINNRWEFIYVHIDPIRTSGSITTGEEIGTIIPYVEASATYEQSDQDHLHFGLRDPSHIIQSVNPSPCLSGLTR